MNGLIQILAYKHTYTHIPIYIFHTSNKKELYAPTYCKKSVFKMFIYQFFFPNKLSINAVTVSAEL